MIPLPNKEQALFRSIVKCYELKHYKKGLKASDAVLKKYPQHGETLAMRGLLLNCMKKKEEAYEYVRKGLKYDLKSHVCWHVYGLLYRSDWNYEEAIKCYRNALRIDPDNAQILRDLYLMEIQTRDLKGFVETRRKMLAMKPNVRLNWLGYAISHHVNGNVQLALDILNQYMETLEKGRKGSYDDSEMCFYRNALLEEMGDLNKCLAALEEDQEMMVDRLLWKCKKAQFLTMLGRFEEALPLYEELLDENADEFEYHRGVQCCLLQKAEMVTCTGAADLPVTVMDIAENHPAYVDLLSFYDRRRCKIAAKKEVIWQRLPLNFVSGTEFRHRLDRYLRPMLTRGVPSLGAEMSFVYANTEKTDILEKLILSYVTSLETSGSFPPRSGPLMVDESPKTAAVEAPAALLWTMYLAAQHFDRCEKADVALEWIEKCISHTPTILDFYQRKARILKHMGDLQNAANVMVEARLLDLADRYINNKATEYLLQANRIEEADATIALFTRHEGDPQQNLFDMQCMWYELACGESNLRQCNFGPALKKFAAVEKHFKDMEDDEFDFHSYCMRKVTLRTYLQLLRCSDTLFGHPFFKRAAHGSIEAYLSLFAKSNVTSCEEGSSSLSAADRKKAKRNLAKARKAEFKRKEEEMEREKKVAEEAEKEALLTANKESKKKGGAGKRPLVVDPDRFGDALASKPALEEAWRFVTILQKYCPTEVKTHLYAFDVAILMGKYLLCIQALNRLPAARTVAEQMDINVRIVKLFSIVETKTVLSPSSIVASLLKEAQEQYVGPSLTAHLTKLRTSASTSLDMLVRVGTVTALKGHAEASTLLPLLLEISKTTGSVSSYVSGEKLVRTLSASSAQVQQYRSFCQTKFPNFTYFTA